MPNAVKDKPKGRTNAQVCISFGEDDMDSFFLGEESYQREDACLTNLVDNTCLY